MVLILELHLFGGSFTYISKNDNKEMLTVKQKHVKNILPCLLDAALINIFVLSLCRVLIGRRDPGISTRIHKSQYLPTYKMDIKKFTSSDFFCPPTLL